MSAEFRGEVEQARIDLRRRGVPSSVSMVLAPRLADARRDACDRAIRPFPWLDGAATPHLSLPPVHDQLDRDHRAAANLVAALGVAAVWDELLRSRPPCVEPPNTADRPASSRCAAGGVS